MALQAQETQTDSNRRDSKGRVALCPSLQMGKHIQWKYRAEPFALNSVANKGFEVLLKLPLLPVWGKALVLGTEQI